MKTPPDPVDESPADNDVVAGVRRRRARQERGARDGSPTLAAQLARVGVMGWIIVMPTLLGGWIGRLIDHAAASGVFWSGSLLVAGLALGCWSAWKWVHTP